MSESIAGRYDVEDVLGRGGMGTVYRVRDRRSGQVLALKRGWASDSRRAQRRAALLEREYHTLAQLAHPRIIAVYEYGLDAGGPYYTMELLEGDDLELAGRLDWKTACSLLHDVASSLAILHARGLLHRDISLRNVRRTPEGRAKLIDFGGMMAMGVAKDVIGTPPFVAPEVLQMQELDGRSDLFALGAIGYRILSGRQAYPAQRFAELRDIWRSRPPPLARIAPEVPAALGALIGQLLSLDRDARPSSAAEVMERLEAIAGLPAEERALVSRAYLTTPALVGRERALVQVRREILSLVRRDGGTLLIEGAAGSGRSRMLAACVLEGKLLGVSVLRVDAGDSASGDWGVARRLCADLCAELPQQALEASRLTRDVLAHVIDGLDEEQRAEAPPPARSLLLRALRDFVLELSRHQRLLVAVDDVDKIDEPSAALLAALAHKSARHALMLVLTTERSNEPSSSASLRLLRLMGRSLELSPLDADQTLALLRSIFGDVPNLQLVAARVFALAQGNARATLDLVSHLVTRGLACYQAGSWLLPAQLDAADLPQTLAEGYRARLAALSPDAYALCEVQAVADEPLRASEYAELATLSQYRQVFAALDELVAARVFGVDADCYRFAQPGFAPVALAAMSEQRLRGLHSRAADLFARGERPVLRRVDHLLRAGRDREAVSLLCSLDLQAQLPPVALLEQAIAAAEREQFAPRMLHQLRTAVLSKASVVLAADSFEHHFPIVLARLERDSGLAYLRELVQLPEAERLRPALEHAQQQWLATPEAERVLSPLDAIRELGRLAGAVCSYGLQLFDAAPLLSVMAALQPLAPLSAALTVLRDVLTYGLHWIDGHQLDGCAIAERNLQRISEPDRGGLDEAQHRRTRLGLSYAIALLEAGWGMSSVEGRAALLESDREYRVNGFRLRMVMYLAQGRVEEARKCQRRAELMHLQESSEQRYHDMSAGAEVVAYADGGDLLAVKSLVETLRALAARYPGWRAMHGYGVCRYRWLQGDLQGALETIVTTLPFAPAGQHNSFVWLAGAHVRLLHELGRIDEGLSVAREYLGLVERLQLTAGDDALWIGYSELLAASGEHAAAVQNIEQVIATAQRRGRAGMALGTLYETRARIALRAGDPDAFAHHAELCAREYERAENPLLSARLARLLDDATQRELVADEPLAPLREMLAQSQQVESEYDTVHSRMLECVDSLDRARCALTLLMQATESANGYLFGVREDRAQLLAALPDGPLEPGMTRWVEDCALGGADEVTVERTSEETASQSSFCYTDADGRKLEPVFMFGPASTGRSLAAVLVLQVPEGRHTLPPRRMLDDLASELLAHGDVG